MHCTENLMRHMLILLTGLLLTSASHAISLDDLSSKDAGKGLKEALTQGAGKAVDLLGKPDGFLGNPQDRKSTRLNSSH